MDRPQDSDLQAAGGARPDAIVIRAAGKQYGEVRALDHLDLSIRRGEFVALLGPNGAGKTTLILLMGGYLRPDQGTVEVFGKPPANLTPQERNRWGFVFQDRPGLYPELTVREHLVLYRAYYERPLNPEALLETLDLTRLAGRRAEELSGGERRRLELALAFLGNPELVFLDEPTTGLDPQARQGMWNFLTGMKRDGVTFVMTTHYLNEVEALADRLLVLDRGRLLFEGPPEMLKQKAGATREAAGALEAAYLKLLEGANDARA